MDGSTTLDDKRRQIAELQALNARLSQSLQPRTNATTASASRDEVGSIAQDAQQDVAPAPLTAQTEDDLLRQTPGVGDAVPTSGQTDPSTVARISQERDAAQTSLREAQEQHRALLAKNASTVADLEKARQQIDKLLALEPLVVEQAEQIALMQSERGDGSFEVEELTSVNNQLEDALNRCRNELASSQQHVDALLQLEPVVEEQAVRIAAMQSEWGTHEHNIEQLRKQRAADKVKHGQEKARLDTAVSEMQTEHAESLRRYEQSTRQAQEEAKKKAAALQRKAARLEEELGAARSAAAAAEDQASIAPPPQAGQVDETAWAAKLAEAKAAKAKSDGRFQKQLEALKQEMEQQRAQHETRQGELSAEIERLAKESQSEERASRSELDGLKQQLGQSRRALVEERARFRSDMEVSSSQQAEKEEERAALLQQYQQTAQDRDRLAGEVEGLRLEFEQERDSAAYNLELAESDAQNKINTEMAALRKEMQRQIQSAAVSKDDAVAAVEQEVADLRLQCLQQAEQVKRLEADKQQLLADVAAAEASQARLLEQMETDREKTDRHLQLLLGQTEEGQEESGFQSVVEGNSMADSITDEVDLLRSQLKDALADKLRAVSELRVLKEKASGVSQRTFGPVAVTQAAELQQQNADLRARLAELTVQMGENVSALSTRWRSADAEGADSRESQLLRILVDELRDRSRFVQSSQMEINRLQDVVTATLAGAEAANLRNRELEEQVANLEDMVQASESTTADDGDCLQSYVRKERERHEKHIETVQSAAAVTSSSLRDELQTVKGQLADSIAGFAQAQTDRRSLEARLLASKQEVLRLRRAQQTQELESSEKERRASATQRMLRSELQETKEQLVQHRTSSRHAIDRLEAQVRALELENVTLSQRLESDISGMAAAHDEGFQRLKHVHAIETQKLIEKLSAEHASTLTMRLAEVEDKHKTHVTRLMELQQSRSSDAVDTAERKSQVLQSKVDSLAARCTELEHQLQDARKERDESSRELTEQLQISAQARRNAVAIRNVHERELRGLFRAVPKLPDTTLEVPDVAETDEGTTSPRVAAEISRQVQSAIAHCRKVQSEMDNLHSLKAQAPVLPDTSDQILAKELAASKAEITYLEGQLAKATLPNNISPILRTDNEARLSKKIEDLQRGLRTVTCGRDFAPASRTSDAPAKMDNAEVDRKGENTEAEQGLQRQVKQLEARVAQLQAEKQVVDARLAGYLKQLQSVWQDEVSSDEVYKEVATLSRTVTELRESFADQERELARTREQLSAEQLARDDQQARQSAADLRLKQLVELVGDEKRKLQDSQAECEQKRDELASVQSALQHQLLQNSALETEAAQLRSDHQVLTQQIDQLTAENDEMRMQLQASEDDYQNLRRSAEENERKLRSQWTDSEASQRSDQERVSSLQQEVERLRAAREELEGQCERLQAQIAACEGKSQEADEQCRTLRQQLASLESSAAASQRQATASFETMQQRITSLEASSSHPAPLGTPPVADRETLDAKTREVEQVVSQMQSIVGPLHQLDLVKASLPGPAQQAVDEMLAALGIVPILDGSGVEREVATEEVSAAPVAREVTGSDSTAVTPPRSSMAPEEAMRVMAQLGATLDAPQIEAALASVVPPGGVMLSQDELSAVLERLQLPNASEVAGAVAASGLPVPQFYTLLQFPVVENREDRDVGAYPCSPRLPDQGLSWLAADETKVAPAGRPAAPEDLPDWWAAVTTPAGQGRDRQGGARGLQDALALTDPAAVFHVGLEYCDAQEFAEAALFF
mmetsp:Transcript_9526/g.24298  ORF Transcript_9526/g.24298 Transcript_9526/m.24298 type:complete len:1779 (-) Transcript_9526:394-5730(-)